MCLQTEQLLVCTLINSTVTMYTLTGRVALSILTRACKALSHPHIFTLTMISLNGTAVLGVPLSSPDTAQYRHTCRSQFNTNHPPCMRIHAAYSKVPLAFFDVSLSTADSAVLFLLGPLFLAFASIFTFFGESD